MILLKTLQWICLSQWSDCDSNWSGCPEGQGHAEPKVSEEGWIACAEGTILAVGYGDTGKDQIQITNKDTHH